LKKKILASTLLAACVAFSLAPSQKALANVTIKGVVRATAESPFSLSGWFLGKTSDVTGAAISEPLKAAGIAVAAPGKIGHTVFNTLGDAVEMPGNMVKQILFSIGDNTSDAVTAPIDAAREIVTAPKGAPGEVPADLKFKK